MSPTASSSVFGKMQDGHAYGPSVVNEGERRHWTRIVETVSRATGLPSSEGAWYVHGFFRLLVSAVTIHKPLWETVGGTFVGPPSMLSLVCRCAEGPLGNL